MPGEVPETTPLLRAPVIAIQTNGLLKSREIETIVQPFREVDLGEKRIGLLLRKLNAALVQSGLVTSRARVVGIDALKGTLKIELVAGRIESIREFGNASVSVTNRAFPVQTNDVLYLQDIEQGVHQIQRLRLYQAEVRILPGQTPGTSLLDVHLTETKPWWLQVGIDNQGSKTTGVERARVSLNLENRLGLLDNIGLTYVHARRSEAAIVSLAIPFGYNTWSLSYAASRYTQPLPANLEQKGGSNTATLAWNRVTHLSAAGRDSLDLSLTYGDAARKIDDIPLASERLAVFKASATRLRQGDGWRAWGEVGLSQGLPYLGARNDDAVANTSDPHAEFTKFEGHAGLVLAIPSIGIQYIGQADMQFSQVGLFGPEQFRLGGMNSIRGYDESIAAGDRGYSFRHELHIAGSQFSAIPATGGPYIFADHGSTRLIGGQPVRLSGAGVGLRLAAKNWAADLAIAKPLDHSSLVTAKDWHLHASFRIDL